MSYSSSSSSFASDDDNSINDDEYAAHAQKLVSRVSKRKAMLQVNGKSSEGADGSHVVLGADFSFLELKSDHISRPCWTCPDGAIYLEAFHELYDQANDFLVAISEPVARPDFIHQYKLTPFSLYAAMATNIETERIIQVLERLSKNKLPPEIPTFIRDCTEKYGKAKLVLKHNKFYVESEFPHVLRELLRDSTIAQARVKENNITGGDCLQYKQNKDGFLVQDKALEMKENLLILNDDDEDEDDDEEDVRQKQANKTVVSFHIKADAVESVKRQAIELDYPLMEEYDFRNDTTNPNVYKFDLKPQTKIRHYQERSLAKMFGNGRARSGIIVLPCGAGKTLTGVTAAQTIKKSCVVLCTSAVSVMQWKFQFQLWTNLPDDRISIFTSDRKDTTILNKKSRAGIVITTYSMISFGGKRSQEAQRIMNIITNRDWGLLLMDEVHVVPAATFRRVVANVKAHCRLGLTATLVREDDLISDLNFLIGPKLYEANWMDLTAQGYLANVECLEVWCPMTGPFMKEYLNVVNNDARRRQSLYVMNPSKLRATEFLVRFHEARGDKIIIFSDLVSSLKLYAKMLKRPFICGATPERERRYILGLFRTNDASLRTICLSKVGDTSIDLPEANVIIQVSSHFGARRQEAQRLGRILRPKSFTTSTSSTGSRTFNAFFYTLVSTDTREMYYSAKRQQYLIDQGYRFKIVTDLVDKANESAKTEGYAYASPKDDEQLLRTILLSSEADLEKEQRVEDEAIRKRDADGAALADAKSVVKRGIMSALSGGNNKRNFGGNGESKRHPLFQKRPRRR